jgi:cation diffusion facilitator CzcD-associated flavoprotein CzcO
MNSAGSSAGEQLDAVIIGAGFSGLYMLHRLRNLGLRCRVYETGEGVGGTWYWNRYPGARCDSESYFYCYSFSDEILQEWTWTERFPSQQEIKRYLEFVSDRLDLWPDIQLATRVTAATYDDESLRWRVETSRGDTVSTRYVVTAIGAISAANVPDIPGLASFEGRWYHTGKWPHEGVDLTGLRVGVIGTGSTGVQLIPLEPEFMAEIKANYPEVWERVRRHPGGMPLAMPTQRFDEVDDDEARRRYEAAWAHGGVLVLQQFTDLMTDEQSNEFCADFFRDKIRSTVHDPVTAEKLVPKGYPIAAKRPVLDTDYFETFNKPHVHLVDVKEAPIEEITPKGLRAGGVEYELDVIVFATGFDAFSGSFLRIDIRGRNGVRLADRWQHGPTAYLGLSIAGFPNLLTVNGPCNPAVLTNVPATIEHDVEWIAGCIEYAEQRGITAIEATEDAERDWVRYTAKQLDGTLYMKADSWWMGANIAGKPRVFMAFAGGLNKFRKRCAEIAEAGYKGFQMTTSRGA